MIHEIHRLRRETREMIRALGQSAEADLLDAFAAVDETPEAMERLRSASERYEHRRNSPIFNDQTERK